ncbi:MarR family winged helix-turn-helix transcriptional regulator [Clostridium ganghwense]|uniref:MarR family transcriptional regulator n=1 Tax=Clostridium ganghwense TaxID=312089 RepID=A0ABT4CM55_9CLOT|nr:MarR family transcriptional regulator [Clostridium ganghwense]MCY6370125.1 MarR family transcriptional regulator [Clostridium ganghwense]
MESREVSKQFINFIMSIRNFFKAQTNSNSTSNVTHQQFSTLMTVKHLNKAALKDLSKEIKVSKSSLCIMLNKMVDEGYVERETDPKDRRNTFYSLSSKGEEFLGIEVENRLYKLDKRIDRLSEERKEKFYECLVEIEKVLEEISNEEA